MDDADFERVAYYDPTYRTGWVHDPEGVARLLAQRHGFIVLDARRLARWMKAVTERDPSRTVCVMLQGMFPDTVAESRLRKTTARRYLDAGGRLVSAGDVPFFQVDGPGGRRSTWGHAGQQSVLGVGHDWYGHGEMVITQEGRDWGLELPDTGDRCAPGAEVLTLRGYKDPHWMRAATWHKVFDPRHPLQGFLRYRGGALDHVHWNAKVNELARLALRGLEEPFRAPESWRDFALASAPRAVFSDPRYPASWSPDAESSAAALAKGWEFTPRDADALARWMRAQVHAGAAGSVCVILHGVAPDTVFDDDPSPQCLARRYLDAGGRLVWAGDVPFFYRGRADGAKDYRNDAGTHEAVLDIPVRWDWEMPGASGLTDAGRAFGLRTSDEALRCADASCVTTVLAGAGAFASSWLKTYAKDAPGSGFLRFRGGGFRPELVPELAAAALHALPPRPVLGAAELPQAEGERAGSGTFVVDRDRALSKLMQFMLPAPELFLQPLARVAAASGSKYFHVDDSGRDLVVEFAGRPIPPEAVRDPFAAVTGESEDPRLRAWGLAVLTALRARPKEVWVSSRGAGAAAAARVLGPGDVREAAVAGGAGTLLRIVAPRARMPGAAQLRRALAARAPVFAERLLPRGERPPPAPAEYAFDDDGVYGVLRVPEAPAVTSNLLVCVQGVGAATVGFVLGGAAPVEGWVDDDRLGLNASLNGVVRDERLWRLRDFLSQRQTRLLRVASALAADLARARAARLARPGIPALWDGTLHPAVTGRLAAAWGALARRAVPDALEAEVRREAVLVRWLRDSCGGLRGLEADSGDSLRMVLWRAPLFTGVDGAPLSLEALELSRRVYGQVAWVERLGASVPPGRAVVWAPCEGEREALRRRFGDAVRAGGAVRARPGRALGALERAGVPEVLARVPIPGGEVGLSAASGRPGLKVRTLKGAEAESYTERGHGFLRLEAAVEGLGAAQAADAAVAAAEGLYRALATGYACPVAFGAREKLSAAWRRLRQGPPLPREDAVLGHLRDYLAHSLASGGPGWPRSLPVFQVPYSWASHEGLLAKLEADGALVSAPEGRQLDLFRLGFEPVIWRAQEAAAFGRFFPGLERVDLPRFGGTLWTKVPPRPSCGHGALYGCLAAGSVGGEAVHLAVDPRGRPLLYPEGGPQHRPASVAEAGRLAYDAALAVAVRNPQALLAGSNPLREFVLAVAARHLAPWPGRPGTAALRAVLCARLTFRGAGHEVFLDSLQSMVTSDHPLRFARPGKRTGTERYELSRREEALLKACWPAGRDRLMTGEQYARYEKSLAVQGGSYTSEHYARARRAARPQEPAGGRRRAADLPEVMEEVGAACGSWSAAARLAVGKGPGKALVAEAPSGFGVDAAHRAAVVAAGAPGEAGLAYLASCVHTAVNRLKGAVTDADDARFQEALAAWAAGEATGPR